MLYKCFVFTGMRLSAFATRVFTFPMIDDHFAYFDMSKMTFLRFVDSIFHRWSRELPFVDHSSNRNKYSGEHNNPANTNVAQMLG